MVDKKQLRKRYTQINGVQVPLIMGGKGGCFPAGTTVHTPVGYIPIEHIGVGELVYCFDKEGNIHEAPITKLWIHNLKDTPDRIVEIEHEKGKFRVTSNHYIFTQDGNFKEAQDFGPGDYLTLRDGSLSQVLANFTVKDVDKVYNITVDVHHTYIANDIRVSNKGGGKSSGGGATAAPGKEDPNSLFSTDILFLTVALGEGPLYRINPNGLQDIEINEGNIDSLLNLDSNGAANGEFFQVESRTGTITQDVMPVFGEETVTPQNMSRPIILKNGNINGVPRSAVTLQNTSVGAWDVLRFIFNINALQRMDSKGNIFSYNLSVSVTIYDSTGLRTIASQSKNINGKTNIPFRFTLDIPIPSSSVSTSGYRFTVEKTSSDSDSSKIQDLVEFIGWQEIRNDNQAYPRTALIGYALKSFAQYTGSVPTFTCMVKGLLCKVPNNYDQPTLANGEVDWRHLECPNSGSNSYYSRGYYLQSTGNTRQTTRNPTIYKGLWDGSFSYSWTQNPVWILYDLLTNTTYGLGIPEDRIDKYRFYKIAQYCDAVDPKTGKWNGVEGFSDGTFRYKPLGLFNSIRERLVGLSSGTPVQERRFICDITIGVQKQVIDLVAVIAGLFRGILFHSGGKLTLNVDLPDEMPVGIFSEANILKDSLAISGVNESELLTGVEVTYIEPNNHYRREVVRVDDTESLKEHVNIENLKQVELTGCTRRSQAIRFAQYLLASSKYIRRKITFDTTSEAINLTVGEVIAVSQRATGTAWGYGGKVSNNAIVGRREIQLEHFTSPAMTASTFTANTLPIGLRVIGKNTDKVDLYMLSNSVHTSNSVLFTNGSDSSESTVNTASSATVAGLDTFFVRVIAKYQPDRRTFNRNSLNFTADNAPTRGDLWTFGEIDPNDFYRGQNDKLYKITAIEKDGQEKTTISASEYISNVYIDSDTLISYVPVVYKDTISPLIAPPAPTLAIRAKLVSDLTGALRNDLEVFSFTDTSGYPINIETEFEYTNSEFNQVIESIS